MGVGIQPKVAMIMGDAAGIGPEIVAKSLTTEETRRLCIPAVIGDARVMAEAVRLTGIPLKIVIRRSWAEVTGEAGLLEMFDLANLDPGEYKMGEVSARAGKACLEYLDFAISQALDGQAEAIVFAPLNKLAMSLGNPGFQRGAGIFCQIYPSRTLWRDQCPGTPLHLPGDLSYRVQGYCQSPLSRTDFTGHQAASSNHASSRHRKAQHRSSRPQSPRWRTGAFRS